MLIGIVAGELSGDTLGASFIEAFKRYYPDCQFVGVAGPQMIAQGCSSLFPMERLSVMGASEVIKRLPDLLKARRQVIDYFLEAKPDVFIGIDAPDFNLGVEQKLKKAGIKTVHYVSPSVWAWREGRIHKIKRAVDLMLTLFPFETAIYQKYAIPVEFVGHPLADRYSKPLDRTKLRNQLAIPQNEKVLALLPGSRHQEIKQLAQLFINVANNCASYFPLQVVIPAANEKRFREINDLVKQTKLHPSLHIQVLQGQVDTALTVADAAIVASGTVTLEAMLLNCPMIIAYKFAPLSWWIAKMMVKTPYVGLPNLLAQKAIAPEYLQHAATEAQLTATSLKLLNDTNYANAMRAQFVLIKKELQKNAGENSAQAVMKLLK
jgi:lipid-A-disaccharide synthase